MKYFLKIKQRIDLIQLLSDLNQPFKPKQIKTMTSFCFYIPSVHMFIDENDIFRVFTNIGVIYRIDFIPVNKKPGFKENLSEKFKSVFVHMSDLFTHGKEIKNVIQTTCKCYKFYPFPNSSEFWLLSKANYPVQETMMNNSQIVHNCLFLETKIEEQAATIKSLTEKLERLHSVVYQLVGGLYCHNSQTQTLNDHLHFLYPENYDERSRFEEPDDSKWKKFPTTRQGDECERRIEDLEKSLLETRQVVAEKEDDIELQIQALEQKFSELTIEPVFTPYEQQNGNEPEDNEEPEDNKDQDTALYARKFAPIHFPYIMNEYPVSYQTSDYVNINDDNSSSTHSSMPDLINDDEYELACFKTRGELQRLYYSSRPETSDFEKDYDDL